MKEIKSIKEIQNISLNILKFVDEVCKENNIQYSLGGGTAIGAVRHGGFIPWDDDIDIIMTRSNYNKFLKIMENNTNMKYKCIHFPKSYYCFTKIVDTDTVLEEKLYKKIDDLGVYIDIFAADNMNEKTFKKDLNKTYRYQLFTMMAASKKFNLSKRGILPNIIKILIYPFVKLFGPMYWANKAIKYSQKHNNTNCKMMGVYFQYKEKDAFPKEIFDNYTFINFEGNKFPIMKDYDKYLTQLYGNYMQLPPKEKQITHHDFVAYYKKEQD